LIVIISVIVLVVLVGGAVGAIALLGKKSNATNQTSGTPTATSIPPTPTQPAVPAGFTQYSGADFSIDYPSDWEKSSSSGDSGVTFTGPAAQIFEVINFGSSPLSPAETDSAFCMGVGKQTAGPTAVTINGQQWTREECQDTGGELQAVVESVKHNGKIYLITYLSTAAEFSANQSQFFTPMEQTFTFLS
jgi:hypothetical protein